jgi:hypothetical protein
LSQLELKQAKAQERDKKIMDAIERKKRMSNENLDAPTDEGHARQPSESLANNNKKSANESQASLKKADRQREVSSRSNLSASKPKLHDRNESSKSKSSLNGAAKKSSDKLAAAKSKASIHDRSPTGKSKASLQGDSNQEDSNLNATPAIVKGSTKSDLDI